MSARARLFALLTVLIPVGVWVQACSTGLSGALSEPLTDLRGRPAVVDFPDLESFGEELPVPDGWGYLQVNEDGNFLVTLLPLGSPAFVVTQPLEELDERSCRHLARDVPWPVWPDQRVSRLPPRVRLTPLL